MEETFVPLRGIKNDLKGRLLCYKQDWTGGLRAGIRLAEMQITLSMILHLEKHYFSLRLEYSCPPPQQCSAYVVNYILRYLFIVA